MRLLRLLLVFAALCAAPAFAQPAPVQAPIPEWVEKLPVPPADPTQAGKPIQMLLITAQSRYGDPTDHYLESAIRIQNAQGLNAMGTITLPWQPDRIELIVHKVHILREGQTIDLLADGQTFTVLRRENNLEAAVLDGMLTAMLQAEGLAIGDVLNVAFSFREKKGTLDLRGENHFFIGHDASVRQVRYRQVWPETMPMKWRAAPVLGTPRITKTRWGRELTLDLRDPKIPAPPEDAPVRYRVPALLELSEYSGWSDISRLFAPAYASARTIDANSPLRQEIARIAAATDDPEKRAMMALRLVQEKIRYLALALGEGGLVPATADQTWKRKFGDCKGKTVTLLALLDGLGIEAEPVVVSNGLRGSVSDRLPMVKAFDHVIVRARVNGRSLWLDGTRIDASTIEELASSQFGAGLPIRAAGADLERLSASPPSAPLSDVDIVWDASSGFDKTVRASGRMTLRGEFASSLRQIHAMGEEAQFKDGLKDFVPGVPNEDVVIDSITPDEAANSLSFTFHADTRLAWTRVSPSDAIRIKFDDKVVEWHQDFEREDKSHKDIPFQLHFPVYLTSRETIILPSGGKGFRIEATNFDKEVAGTRIARTVTLEGGKAVAVSTFRRLRDEVSAAEAAAAIPILNRINNDEAYVRSPDNYPLALASVAGGGGSEPESANDFIERGYRALTDRRMPDALADFDRAIALAPRNPRAHANRVVALIHSGKLKDAQEALAQAESVAGSDKDFVIAQARGLLHLRQNNPGEAAEAFTRSLALHPENAFTLGERAAAYAKLGRFSEALDDLNRAIELDSSNAGLLQSKARLAAFRGDEKSAIETVDRLIALEGQSISAHVLKGEILRQFGKKEEAARPYERALQLVDEKLGAESNEERKADMSRARVTLLAAGGRVDDALAQSAANLKLRPDDATDLNEACWTRVTSNVELEKALELCERALAIKPDSAATIDSRAWVKLRLGRVDDAIADFDKALALVPDLGASLYGRGIARYRKGDREGAARDLKAARLIAFDMDSRFRLYGVEPPALD